MKKRILRKRLGMGTLAAVALMGGSLMLGLTMVSVTMTSHRLATRSSERQQALALAEAGISQLYAKIKGELSVGTEFGLALGEQQLYHNQDLNDPEGKYNARVVSTSQVSQDVDRWGVRVRQVTYNFTIEGLGKTAIGVTARLRCNFTGVTEYELRRVGTETVGGDTPQQFFFPRGALAAAEQIKVVANSLTTLGSSPAGAGHVIANEGISWTPAAGNKADFGAQTMLSANGQYVVNQSALTWTQGSAGLGNTNGQTNYTSPPAPGASVGNQIMYSNSPINFADSATAGQWDTRWQQNAGRDPARVFGATGASGLPATSADLPTGNVLETPAYIRGDLTVGNSDTLVLKPSSSNPMKNVVYVEGNINNLGKILNLGVKVVVRGRYTEDSNAEYRIETQGSPFANRQRVLQNSSLISVSSVPNSIEFTSTVSGTTGLVYAVRGGIRIAAPGRTLEGAFIAGGTAGTGGIVVNSGTGAGTTINFSRDATIPGDIDLASIDQIDINYTIGGVYSPFAPSTLSKWIEVDSLGRAVKVSKTIKNLLDD